MLTGVQICCPAALGWSINDLADKAGVATKTIRRLKPVDGIPLSRTATLLEIKALFESAGIEFIGSPTYRPGICYFTTPIDRTIAPEIRSDHGGIRQGVGGASIAMNIARLSRANS